MAYFLNSDFRNNEFELVSNDKYFVDKTKMIEKTNELINIKDRFLCITRPRRFGKTINAMMLASYYSKNANFKNLFDKLEISKSSSYLQHLNKHNVIYMTLNQISSPNCTYKEFISGYADDLINDLQEIFPNVQIKNTNPIYKILTQVYNQIGQGFIFIIDEWDYIFNNNLFSEGERKEFLEFLRDLLIY